MYKIIILKTRNDKEKYMLSDFVWFFQQKKQIPPPLTNQEKNSPKHKDCQILNTHVNKVFEQLYMYMYIYIQE